MAKRVRRVRRTKRTSRMKTAQQVADQQVDGVSEAQHNYIDADGPDGDGASGKFGAIAKKRRAKGKKGGDAEIDLSETGSDMADDTGADGDFAVSRKGGAGMGGGDSFGGQDQREAYEEYLRRNVEGDAA